jgi:hypothetical protein
VSTSPFHGWEDLRNFDPKFKIPGTMVYGSAFKALEMCFFWGIKCDFGRSKQLAEECSGIKFMKLSFLSFSSFDVSSSNPARNLSLLRSLKLFSCSKARVSLKVANENSVLCSRRVMSRSRVLNSGQRLDSTNQEGQMRTFSVSTNLHLLRSVWRFSRLTVSSAAHKVMLGVKLTPMSRIVSVDSGRLRPKKILRLWRPLNSKRLCL